MTKKEMRALAKERLANIKDRERQNEYITRRVTNSPYFNCASTVFVFIGTGDEVDTRGIIEDCWLRWKLVCIPKILEDGTMTAVELHSFDELVPDKYGIPTVPNGKEVNFEKPDLAVVPGLAFDRNGYRLGRGKGYYDKYLKESYAFTFGVCYEEQIVDEVPREPHDIRMNIVVTGQEEDY